MVATVFSGPLVSAGPMFGGTSGVASTPGSAPVYSGASISYQGVAIPDVRYTPMNKDNLLPATIHSHYMHPTVYSVNAIPSTLGAAKVAALANVVSGTAMTLVTAAAAGISTNVPILPFGATATVNAPIGLDLGTQSGNCTAASTSITVSDTTRFVVGEPIIIPNVGNAGGTAALITKIVSITNSTVMVVANAPLATNAAVPVCTGSDWSNLFNGSPALINYWHPYLQSGPALMFDMTQGISRGVNITGVTGGTGGTFTVSGYDIYCRPQTETITVAAGASVGTSKKTYKFIQSVSPNFTDAHNYSVGTTDLYGFAIRNDQFEFVTIYFAGVQISSATGYTSADIANPATATSGDVRGTYATQTASNGTNRLVISHDMSLANSISASPNTPQFFYGSTPA